MTSLKDDLLLELVADDAATRDDLVEGLSDLLSKRQGGGGGDGENGDGASEATPTRGKSVMERTAKQAYFMERDLELTKKRRAAEKRKEKFMVSSGRESASVGHR